MIKRISLVRRKDGMTRESFVAHWMGPHAEIVQQLPGLLGLRFGIVQQWSSDGPAWDGIGESWFESVSAAERAFATEPYRSQLIEDRKNFFGHVQWCFVEEHTAVQPPL